jgi:glycosyltransferase involved in cell wall biosynthesis
MSCNTPLDPQRMLLSECRRIPVPFVFWVQDLVGVATNMILRRRLPVIGAGVGRYYMAMERRIALGSDALVVISEDFTRILEDWSVSLERQFVIENWAPIDEIDVAPRDNVWAREHGLVTKTCFLYSGMMGMKHNPALILGLAERLRGHDDVAVVVVSEGLGAQWLAEKKAERGLDNLMMLGFQPYDRLPEVLGTGDVLIAILEADAGIFSVPSKVLSYLCAGHPILAAIPPENLAARIIARNDAGLVVSPTDNNGFADAAERLQADAALRRRLAANGRAYAERTFQIDGIVDRFEDVVRQVLS